MNHTQSRETYLAFTTPLHYVQMIHSSVVQMIHSSIVQMIHSSVIQMIHSSIVQMIHSSIVHINYIFVFLKGFKIVAIFMPSNHVSRCTSFWFVTLYS